MGLEEIIGKNVGLGKAITALTNFKVDPTITIGTLKVVLLNEFCRNVCNFNADIFRVTSETQFLSIVNINIISWYLITIQ